MSVHRIAERSCVPDAAPGHTDQSAEAGGAADGAEAGGGAWRQPDSRAGGHSSAGEGASGKTGAS